MLFNERNIYCCFTETRGTQPAINQLLTQYLPKFGKSLEHHQTCKGRCDHKDVFTCRCDELCPYFGDCCIDYDLVCLNLTTFNLYDSSLYGNLATNTKYECVSDSSLDRNVWLVSHCPASWKQQFIESRCTDPDLSLRVFDQSGINYFNIFCAICHGHSIKDIQPWNMKSPDDVGKKRSLVCAKQALGKTGIRGPSFGKQIRFCNQFIHECPTSYANVNVINLCHKYDLISCPQAFRDERMYKNPFCSLCNNVISNIYCNEERLEGIGELFQFRGSFKANPDTYSNPCLKGEIHDPISLTCHPLTCIQGYSIQNNRCVINNNTSVDSILDNWMCEKYDSLFFVKGSASSLTSVDVFLELFWNLFGGLHIEYMQQASNEDGQLWLAIRFDTNRSLDLFQEKDAFVTKRNVSDIYNDEFLTVCYQQIHDDINCTSDQWYSSPLLNFIRVTHPLYNNVYLSDGIYIMAEIVMFHAKYGRDNMRKLQRQDMLMVCGRTYEITQPDCLLFALSPLEYVIVNGSVLIYHNITINDTNFLIQPDGQVLVCTEVLNDFTSDGIGQDGSYFLLNALDIVSFVNGCISIFCLLATFVTYIRFKKLRNMYGKCIMCLSATLCLAQLFTFLSDKVAWFDDGCVAIAITTHYLWLTMFAWSTNSAIALLQQFVIDKTGNSVESISFAVIVHLFGWGVPLLIVSTTFALHICECTTFVVYDTDGLCWIDSGIVNFVAFGVPVSLSILTNSVILAIALISLRHARQQSNVMQAKKKDEGKMREVIIFLKVSAN